MTLEWEVLFTRLRRSVTIQGKIQRVAGNLFCCFVTDGVVFLMEVMDLQFGDLYFMPAFFWPRDHISILYY